LNVELLTLAEVEAVSGQAGNFSVTVRKNPRYIDMEKCIACGLCAEKCPKKVEDAFNMGINKRKAAYIKYGQAVPLKYAIDPHSCIYLTRGKCRACEKFCPTGAINFNDAVEKVSIHVGSVILAPGFKPFDPAGLDYYGYDTIKDVVTSLEYERLLSASGPNMGHLLRPSDQKEPARVAWLQCVGSRSNNRCRNAYCSSVCCMYAIKQSLVTAEHLSGDDISQTIFYMDIRSHGKEFERYYEDAKNDGIRFVRARPHSIEPGPGGYGVQMRYTTEDGHTRVEGFDMAVLSIGLEAPADALDLADRFGLELDVHNFARTSSFDPVRSSRVGVFVTGAFQAPKAIPRSVAEASAAASGAATLLTAAKGSLTHIKTYPEEMDLAGDDPAVGVFVCSCGINIAGVVDVDAVAEYARSLSHVVHVENNLFTCSADTQDMIAERIREHRLNRIVVAACTPRTHEPLFQETLKEAELNGYLVEMANIRNMNSWVHQREPEKATAKAKDQVRMAVAKVALNQPLEREKVAVTQNALVVGGGVAGLNAALAIADQGFPTTLIESGAALGGNARKLRTSASGEAVAPMLEKLVQQVSNHDLITIETNAGLSSVSGSVGKFESEITVDGRSTTLAYGAAVIATGAGEARPTEYHYGENDHIMTHLEFDAVLRDNVDAVQKASSAVFIQCVGSREPERPYCSRICCNHSVESAIHLKRLNPAMNVYILNRDIRTYGVWETLYKEARDLGVIFIRYTPEGKPAVAIEKEEITVSVTDPLLQRPLKIYADFLVLASGVVPNDNRTLVDLFKCSVSEDGFINEAHPKLRPVDMSVDGLFVAGMCNYPKPIDETIAQARAAAAKAVVILSRKEMELDAIKSFVTGKCDGCALCLDVCPYNAISLVETQDEAGRTVKRIQTDKALCKGCGLCSATCPKEGVMVHGFTMDQLKAQVQAAIEEIGRDVA
jgi:heterodisulfide reductase subunit A